MKDGTARYFGDTGLSTEPTKSGVAETHSKLP